MACGGESCQLEATPPATERSAALRYSIEARCLGSSAASSSSIRWSMRSRSSSTCSRTAMADPIPFGLNDGSIFPLRAGGRQPSDTLGSDAVAVAQSAEHQVVVLGVGGSSPLGHPKVDGVPLIDSSGPLAQSGRATD